MVKTFIMESNIKKTIIYARVSSKEQEKEGFSIPAQLKLLKKYAYDNKFVICNEFIDVETAKKAGRESFGEMIKYLKTFPDIKSILIKKLTGFIETLKITPCLKN